MFRYKYSKIFRYSFIFLLSLNFSKEYYPENKIIIEKVFDDLTQNHFFLD